MEKKILHILTYDHGGYVLWGDKLRDRFSSAIDWLNKYPLYKTGLDFEAFTFDELDRIDPEFKQTIAEALKKYAGRLGLGSTTYGQPLSLFISEESNVRQLTYAIRTNLRHFGCTPSVYAISEFALNNQMPQLLKLCGYKAALMRTHVMNYGYTRTFDSAWGLWVGRDGTGLPTVPTADGQGHGYFNCTLDNWILTRWPREAEQSLDYFEKTFEKYEPLLASRYDDLTLREEELVVRAEEKGNCKFVLLEDIPGIYGEATEKLVTTDNDFHGRMPWGYCGNEIFNGIRAAENNVVSAERLNSASVMLGGESMQADLEDAWRNVLVAQHHDVTICGLLNEARRFIPASLAASGKATEASLSAVAAKMADPETEGLLVFNPCDYPVSQWVETEAKDYRSASMDGKALETELSGGKLRIHTQLPGLTAARIDLSSESAASAPEAYTYDESAGILETPLYRLTLTPKGIASLYDKPTGRTLVSNGEGKLFEACINDADCASLGAWIVAISDRSAVAASAGEIGTVSYRFEMKFESGSAAIACKASFDIKDQRIGKIGITKGLSKPLTVNNFVHETKLRFALDLCLDKDRRMVRDMPFSISDWNGQIQKTNDSWYGKNHVLADVEVSPEESFENVTYLDGINWVALRDKAAGLAVINRGCMGSSVLGNSISIPLIYSNDYIWGARYLSGTFDNEFALLPLGTESDAYVHRVALAYEHPVLTAGIPCGNGSMTSFSAGKLCSESGEVILTALYPEDGAVFARFCNYSDSEAQASFVPGAGRVVCEADLLGNAISPCNGKDMSFHPWEIKTLKIEL